MWTQCTDQPVALVETIVEAVALQAVDVFDETYLR